MPGMTETRLTERKQVTREVRSDKLEAVAAALGEATLTALLKDETQTTRGLARHIRDRTGIEVSYESIRQWRGRVRAGQPS